MDQSKFCVFCQKWGHITDECTCMRHEIQDLMDSSKLEDASNRKPKIRNNTLLPQDQSAFAIEWEPLSAVGEEFVNGFNIWV